MLVWVYGQLLLTETGRAYQTLVGLTFTIAPLLLSGGILGLYSQIPRRPVRDRPSRRLTVIGASIVGVVVLVSVVELVRVFLLAPVFAGTVGVPGLLSGSVGHYGIALSMILLGVAGMRARIFGRFKGLPLGIGLLMMSPLFYLLLSLPFFLVGSPDEFHLDFLAYSGLAIFFFLLPFGIAGAGWVVFGLLPWSRAETEA